MKPLVCMAVGELPAWAIAPASTKRPCADCLTPVWVSPSGGKMIEQGLVVAVCNRCIFADTAVIEVEPPTEEQLAELTEYQKRRWKAPTN